MMENRIAGNSVFPVPVSIMVNDDGMLWYRGNDIMENLCYAVPNFKAYFLRKGVRREDCMYVRPGDGDGTSRRPGWYVNEDGLHQFFSRCRMQDKGILEAWLLGMSSRADYWSEKILDKEEP